MIATDPALQDLVGWLRLKRDLLHQLRVTSRTGWAVPVRRFIEALRSHAPENRVVALTLLADVTAETVRLLNTNEWPRLRAFADSGSTNASIDELLREFEWDLLDFLRAHTSEPVCSAPVKRIAELIEEHYRDPLTLKSLAAAVGRHDHALAAMFRRERGMTVREYLTRVRIRRATDLIDAGEKIEAVTLLVGYRSKKNLYRHFKAQMGMTPGTYKTGRGDRPLYSRNRE